MFGYAGAPAFAADAGLSGDDLAVASAAAHLIEIIIGDGRADRVGADLDEAALVRVLRALGAT